MNGSYPGIERRRYKRVPVQFIVSYNVLQPQDAFLFFGDKDIDGATQDISEGGMALVTNRDIPELSLISLNFNLTRPMKMQGEVRYNITLGPSNHRLGICFKDIRREDRSVIAKFVAENSN
jgi:c-di-GMP-binding flagellar brake protein YcgR